MGPSGRLVIKTTCTISKPLPWILKALKNEATFTEKRETRSDSGVSNQQECRFSLIIYCVYLWTQSTIPAHDKGLRNILCHTQTPIHIWKQLLASFLIILLWPLTDNLHTFTHWRRSWNTIVLKYTLPFSLWQETWNTVKTGVLWKASEMLSNMACTSGIKDLLN